MTTVSKLPPHQHSGIVDGLAPDTSYEVLVVAHNDYGDGTSETLKVKTSGITPFNPIPPGLFWSSFKSPPPPPLCKSKSIDTIVMKLEG